MKSEQCQKLLSLQKKKTKKSISWAVLVDNAENAKKPIDGKVETLRGMQRTAGASEEMR